MFDPGDRVICIDDSNSTKLPLTVGKVYVVLDHGIFCYTKKGDEIYAITVLNDNGEAGLYSVGRFKLDTSPVPMDDSEYHEIMRAQEIIHGV